MNWFWDILPPEAKNYRATDWAFLTAILALSTIATLLIGWLAILSWPWL